MCPAHLCKSVSFPCSGPIWCLFITSCPCFVSFFPPTGVVSSAFLKPAVSATILAPLDVSCSCTFLLGCLAGAPHITLGHTVFASASILRLRGNCGALCAIVCAFLVIVSKGSCFEGAQFPSSVTQILTCISLSVHATFASPVCILCVGLRFVFAWPISWPIALNPSVRSRIFCSSTFSDVANNIMWSAHAKLGKYRSCSLKPYSFLLSHHFLFKAASAVSTGNVNTIVGALLVLNVLDLLCPGLMSNLCCSHSFEIHASVLSLLSVLGFCPQVEHLFQIDLCCKEKDVPLPCLFCSHQNAPCSGWLSFTKAVWNGSNFTFPSSSAKSTPPISSLLSDTRLPEPVHMLRSHLVGEENCCRVCETFVELKVLASFVQVFFEYPACFENFCCGSVFAVNFSVFFLLNCVEPLWKSRMPRYRLSPRVLPDFDCCFGLCGVLLLDVEEGLVVIRELVCWVLVHEQSRRMHVRCSLTSRRVRRREEGRRGERDFEGSFGGPRRPGRN